MQAVPTFGASGIAEGYATSRPPIHSKILERVRWGKSVPCANALDVGCGAGLSTRALEGFAVHRVAIEPAEAMLRWRRTVAPGCEFLAGSAEKLPLSDRCFDLITAAGALNYVNLDAFFEEAQRVLARDGQVLVYDFSTGRRFRSGDTLQDWFARFQER